MTTTPEQLKAHAEALLNDPNSTDPQVRQIRSLLGTPARTSTSETARREDAIGQIAAEATWHAHRTPANSPCKHCLAAREIAAALTPHIEAMLAQARAEALREAGVR